MEQRYINSDGIGFKDYLRIWNNPVRFHSIGKWFLFCTLKAVIITIPFILIMSLLGLLAGTFPKNPFEAIKFFAALTALFLAVAWVASFYNSFIAPFFIKRKVISFIEKYIPDAKDLTQADTDLWFFLWNNRYYSIAFKEDVNLKYNGRRSGLSILKYIKIALASSKEDYVDWDVIIKAYPVVDGIDIVLTNVNYFARFLNKKKYSERDIYEALNSLSGKVNSAFSQ